MKHSANIEIPFGGFDSRAPAPRDLEQTLAIVNRNHDIQDMSWGAQVLPNDRSKPNKAPGLMSVIPKALVS